MATLRKGNYVRVNTVKNGDVYGQIESMSGSEIMLKTATGEMAQMNREDATKISATEYAKEAHSVTTETFANVDEENQKTPKQVIEERITRVSATAALAPSSDEDVGVVLPTPKEAAAEIIKKKAAKGESKMSKSALIFEEEFAKGAARKDIIARFISEVGLTKAGASTYFQTLKTRHLEDEQ